MSFSHTKSGGQSSLLVRLVGRYREILAADNRRAGIPNWQGQIMMGVLFLLFPFTVYTAWSALLTGHPVSDRVPTGAIHNGIPVMQPLGEMILLTGVIGCVGLAMVLVAIALCPKINSSSK
jgi:hypothetical protein